MALRIQMLLDVPTSTTQGVALDTSAFSQFTFYLSGGATATVQLQVSPDGTIWEDEGSPIVDGGFLQVTTDCMFVRADVTFTSDTPVGNIVAEFSR